MPLILNIDPNGIMDLETFTTHLHEHVHFSDFDSIASASNAFRQLLGCPNIVSDAVNRELADWRRRDDDMRYIVVSDPS